MLGLAIRADRPSTGLQAAGGGPASRVAEGAKEALSRPAGPTLVLSGRLIRQQTSMTRMSACDALSWGIGSGTDTGCAGFERLPRGWT